MVLYMSRKVLPQTFYVRMLWVFQSFLRTFLVCIFTHTITYNYSKWYTSLRTIFINKMATKSEIKEFNMNNFSLWKIKMQAILRKNNYLEAIEEIPAGIIDDKWNGMDGNAIADLYLLRRCRQFWGKIIA